MEYILAKILRIGMQAELLFCQEESLYSSG